MVSFSTRYLNSMIQFDSTIGLHEKSEICQMWVLGGLLLDESFIFFRKIACHWQRYKFSAFCDREEVYL